MGMPVKLSDVLVEVARTEAKITNRSITAQVEHWAKLGRAVELALDHSDLLNLIRSEGDLDIAFADSAKKKDILALLENIARSTERSTITEKLRARKKPVYAFDPGHPGMLVRIQPDGTRTLGRLENRKFIASKTTRKQPGTHEKRSG